MRTFIRVFRMQSSMPRTHVKARCKTYPRNDSIVRCPVPDDKVTWDIIFSEYAPVDYTAPSVESAPVWADPEYKKKKDAKPEPQWNTLDGKVDRKSHVGKYNIDNDNLPKNIVGRTGVCSRGLLGRWGPNHAADPIVTRWKRDAGGNKVKHKASEKYIIQFIAIQRADSGEWAIPGGMVDAGETVTMTLKREFSEEALNILEVPASQTRDILKNVQCLFARGVEVYRGYVDDPRNTDNAWMETVAVNFHDEKGDSVAKFKLHAGDDAVGVKWTDLHGDIKLYASHQHFCELVAKKHGAHW